jgi:membrane-associated phospholipid phosphatase
MIPFLLPILGHLPAILFVLTIYLLIFLQEIQLLLFYIVGFIGNELLNRGLKPILRDPRPKPLSSTDIYGMPSSHSQLAAYSLVFMTLLLQEKYYSSAILLLFLVLTLMTMAQRVITKAHTVEQVIVGALLGGVLGYGFYVLSKKISKKIL